MVKIRVSVNYCGYNYHILSTVVVEVVGHSVVPRACVEVAQHVCLILEPRLKRVHPAVVHPLDHCKRKRCRKARQWTRASEPP